jgi:hypothetical protein
VVSNELSPSSQLWAAYRGTVVDVTVPDGSVRRLRQVDRGGDAWPYAVDHVWIMTACNPRSEPLSESDNLTRHLALGEELRAAGLTATPNVGYDPADPTWSEPGYTIPGAEREVVIALAERREQNAVFGWFPDRWEIVSVLLHGHEVHGWRWA